MKCRDFYKKLTAVGSLGVLAAMHSPASSAQEQVFFDGFENGISNEWSQVEPVTESSVAFEGSGSARIQSTGSMVRTFNIDQNTEYTVRVMVRGGGRLRARWNGNNTSTRVTNPSNNWIERSVTFNSGSANTADISFEYNSESGRFDNLRIERESSGSNTSNPPSNSSSVGATLNIQKQGFNFSIDGNNGAQLNEQIYLWNTNLNNINQQWVEIDRGNGFFSYQKRNTNLCIDGGNGGQRRQAVIIFTCNSNNQNQHWRKVNTTGNSIRFEKRNASGFSIDGRGGAERRQELHLWNSNNNNVNQRWLLTDVNSSGGGSTPTPPQEVSDNIDFGLNPNREPWENFDLSDWALDAPNADPDDNLSARTTDRDFINGELFPGSEPYFFTGSDGAMVFRSNVGGARTSSNTSFPRSELREMLRAGNGDVSTQGVNENNWVLGYQPNNLDFGAHTTNAQENVPTSVGGRGGRLTSTMRVNRVTSTGTSSHVGRVIIGQIHADNDEPLRLYYRKLPNNDLGSVYFTHEIRTDDIRDGDDLDDVNLVGSSSSNASNPSDGIALGELFSYEIINDGPVIEVILRRGDRDGQIIGQGSFNMNQTVEEDTGVVGSGYDRDDEWMYFKAGAYTQNNSGDSNDFDEVAIYRLENTH